MDENQLRGLGNSRIYIIGKLVVKDNHFLIIEGDHASRINGEIVSRPDLEELASVCFPSGEDWVVENMNTYVADYHC